MHQPRLWKETEDKLPDALAAMDDGTLLGSPEHLATVKDAIALHYARSEATRIVHVRIFTQAAAASRNLWLTDWRPRLEAAFYQAKGFYAVGDQALGRFLDEMMQPNLRGLRAASYSARGLRTSTSRPARSSVPQAWRF
jgi:hypothetical protein